MWYSSQLEYFVFIVCLFVLKDEGFCFHCLYGGGHGIWGRGVLKGRAGCFGGFFVWFFFGGGGVVMDVSFTLLLWKE